MPELPDVEVYRRYLDATSLHQPIAHIHVESPSLLFNISPQGLGHFLKHKSFESTARHGKYLFVATDHTKWLVVHFGMTGELKYFPHSSHMPDYTQLRVGFENGYDLAYITKRKLGRIAVTQSPQAWIKRQHLGPDALELSQPYFMHQAAQRRGGVKSWLMDQRCIAGIGNIYSDEILFQAGIHPRDEVRLLDETDRKRLYKAIALVLNTAIDSEAEPDRLPDSFLLPYRRRGGCCPQCDTPLSTTKAAGRTAWYCPRCQHA